MRHIFIAVAALLLALPAGAEETSPQLADDLKRYIGTYEHQQVLAHPSVKRYEALLSDEQKKIFLKNFGVMGPIGYDNGFLVLTACRPHDCSDHSAMLLVKLYNGELVGYIQEKGAYRVFSSKDYMAMADSINLNEDWRTYLPAAMQKHIVWASAGYEKAEPLRSNIELIKK